MGGINIANKGSYMKSTTYKSILSIFKFYLICLLLGLTVLAQAVGGNIDGSPGLGDGAVGGGGSGLFVQPSISNSNLVIWDIYSNNSQFVDREKGDHIKFKDENSSKFRGEYLNFKALNSFQQMKLKVLAWRPFAPNFVKVIESVDFFNDSAKIHPMSEILPFLMTDYYISKIDEIYVDSGSTHFSNLNLFATGYYINNIPNMNAKTVSNLVLTQIENFNNAGLISQGAFFLHERLRQVQSIDGLLNIDLQKIVYEVMTQNPRFGVIPDELFVNSIFNNWPDPEHKFYKTGPVIYALSSCRQSGNAYMLVFSKSNCFMYDYFSTQMDDYLKREGPIDLEKGSIHDAKKNVDKLLETGILSQIQVRPKLNSKGYNNSLSDQTHSPYLFEPARCKSILGSHQDPNYFNGSRWGFHCNDQNILEGTGGLLFLNHKEDISVELHAALDVEYDAGSELEFHFLEDKPDKSQFVLNFKYGWHIKAGINMYNWKEGCIKNTCQEWHSLDISQNNARPIYKNIKTKHIVKIHISRSQNKIQVEFPDSENQASFEIIIPKALLDKLAGNNISYYHQNYMSTYLIKKISK